ncbi:MAG: hypothetical protein IPI84_01595 [Holophagaceae bacterium]|nr:hypothetical protein [Holophagaceae bacterium]
MSKRPRLLVPFALLLLLPLGCGGGKDGWVNESGFTPHIVETTGSGQSANAGTRFPQPIGVRLASDSAQVYLGGQLVLFKLPDGTILSAGSRADGWAYLANPVASSTPGAYQIQAADDTTFSGHWFIQLTSLSAVPATLQVQPGYPASTAVNTGFPGTFQVKALDGAGAPVAGVTIQCSAPTSGASCRFSGGGTSISLVTDATGSIQFGSVQANGTAGTYSITLSAGALSTTVDLTNL